MFKNNTNIFQLKMRESLGSTASFPKLNHLYDASIPSGIFLSKCEVNRYYFFLKEKLATQLPSYVTREYARRALRPDELIKLPLTQIPTLGHSYIYWNYNNISSSFFLFQSSFCCLHNWQSRYIRFCNAKIFAINIIHKIYNARSNFA